MTERPTDAHSYARSLSRARARARRARHDDDDKGFIFARHSITPRESEDRGMDSVLQWFNAQTRAEANEGASEEDEQTMNEANDLDDGNGMNGEDESEESDEHLGGEGEGEKKGETRDREGKNLCPPGVILHPYARVREAMSASDRRGDVPSGLTNGGNTCFAAAALQCLRRATALTAWFDDIHRWHDGARCAEKNKFCVVCEYAKHLERASTSGEAHSIGRLTNDISKVAKQFRRGRQEDSHEFINALLDAMHVVFLKDLGGEKKYDLRTQETTVIYHTFGGYTLGTVKCMTCGFVSKNFQSTLDIPLEVTGKITSIEAALEENYCTEETLSGSNMYKCSKCKTLVRAKKGSKIHVSPNVLTIPLKRYSTGRFSKITKYVHYPDKFSLAPFMSEDAPYEGSDPLYALFGVLVHQDFDASAHSGHYVAYVKLQDGTWVLCNDGRVAASSEKEAMKQKAYILFYERVTPRDGPEVRPPGYLEDVIQAARSEQTTSAPATSVDTSDIRSRLESMKFSSARGVSDVISYSTPVTSVAPVTSAAPSELTPKPSFEIETVDAEDGSNELRISVTLPGCTSVKQFEVELDTRSHGGQVLIIRAASLYADPIQVQLPRNIIDEPRGSTFKRKHGKYSVRFPLLGTA